MATKAASSLEPGSSDLLRKMRAEHKQEIAELRRENALLKKENRQLKALVAQLAHDNAKWRNVKRQFAVMQREIESLKAQNMSLKRRLFGPRSEEQVPSSEADEDSPEDEPPPADDPPRPRGQQRGSIGHGRRTRESIAPDVIVHELPLNDLLCPLCRKPYREMPSPESSEEIDWEVVIRRKVHQRKRYRKTCRCPGVPAFLSAPVPPKLVPKGMLSVGAVSYLLVDKFGTCRPVSKTLELLRLSCGVDIPEGTVAGVMQKVAPLLEPLYEGIVEHNRRAQHWHADETGWKVYEDIKGKSGHNWWLWVFASRECVLFVVDPSRSSKVPRRYIGKGAGPPQRIINSDMWSAYAGLDGVMPAYCWVHVRRYFLEVVQGYGKVLGEWSREWLARIATLYHLNKERLSREPGSPEYQRAQAQLYRHVQEMKGTVDEQVNDPLLHSKGGEVLCMLLRHWKGLTVFLEHPEVPLDNNEAERLLRVPVVGRKNFYGSGSLWSGKLAAMMFSILATAEKNGLNPLTYLRAYLQVSAEAGGKAPESVDRFLPWKMSDEDRAAWSRPPHAQTPLP